MATNDCLPVCFTDVCNKAFYFQETGQDEDVDEDGFQKSSSCKFCWIKNDDSKFLILCGRQFEAKHIPNPRKNMSECKFYIHTYNFKTEENKKSGQDKITGTSVMLYIKQDDKTMVACCNENEIHPEEMNLPYEIKEDQHKAVFFLKQIPSESNAFMFESSTNEGKFLAFEADKSNPRIFKLVLRCKPDEVDCRMMLEDINS